MPLQRLREPSTWAGIAAAFSALGPLFLTQPIVGAVVSVLGAIAVVLREQGKTGGP